MVGKKTAGQGLGPGESAAGGCSRAERNSRLSGGRASQFGSSGECHRGGPSRSSRVGPGTTLRSPGPTQRIGAHHADQLVFDRPAVIPPEDSPHHACRTSAIPTAGVGDLEFCHRALADSSLVLSSLVPAPGNVETDLDISARHVWPSEEPLVRQPVPRRAAPRWPPLRLHRLADGWYKSAVIRVVGPTRPQCVRSEE
jgi:hypothetical protein